MLYFNLREMQAFFGWQAVAIAAADLIVQQLVEAAGLQYSLLPRRDQNLPWACGHTPAPPLPSSISTDAPVTRATGEKSW